MTVRPILCVSGEPREDHLAVSMPTLHLHRDSISYQGSALIKRRSYVDHGIVGRIPYDAKTGSSCQKTRLVQPSTRSLGLRKVEGPGQTVLSVPCNGKELIDNWRGDLPIQGLLEITGDNRRVIKILPRSTIFHDSSR